MKTTTILFLSLLLAFGLSTFAQNNCLDFQESTEIVKTNNAINLSGNTLTLEAWINIRSFQDPSVDYGISSICGIEEGDNIALLRIVESSKVQFDVRAGGVNRSCNIAGFSLGKWYHIAGTFTYDGANYTMILYVNGVSVATASGTSSSAIAANEDFYIGSNFYGRPFDGKIDEVRVWSVVRTETEIRTNMYQEIGGAESGLVAYYKLNESSGTTADNAQGNSSYDCALTNMSDSDWQTSSSMFGPKNTLNFDGSDDYVQIPDADELDLTSNYTLEAWIYPNSFDVSGAGIISKYHTGGANGYYMRLLWDSPRTGISFDGLTTSSGILSTDTWTHIAAVNDNGTRTLYVNGVEVELSGSAETVTSNTDPLRIASDFSGRYFDGQIEELRIWNDVRSTTEIRDNMCKSLNGNESNLVAYYNFDNTTGDKLQDFSGNGNDGTLTNMDNSDWVSSSAFNTWLNTTSTTWFEAGNWSNGIPTSGANVSIYNYTNEPDIPASQTFGCLYLGNGITTGLTAALTVNSSLIINKDLNLNGQTITLGSSGYLFEDAGSLSGTSGQIQTSRTLSNIDENVAGLGAEITTSANMGNTTITRTHAAASNPTSIERRYQISPTTNTGLNATLVFHYDDDELNGQTEADLLLYKSSDGTGWSCQATPTVNTTDNTITLSSIDGFSYWTASEGGFEAPGNALDFDGSDDYVTIPAAASLATSTFTIEFWLYYDGTPTGWKGIVDKGRDSGNKDWYFLTKENSNAGMFGYDGTEIEFPVNNNTWTHVAGLYNGSHLVVYVNGTEIGSTSKAYTAQQNDIIIGRRTSGSDYFNGRIDELRIWGDTRTSTEIQNNMCNTLAGNEDNLVAYYSFNSSSGTTLYDATINASNGTLTGGPVWVNSYAMVLAADATSISDDGFTANWSCPAEANSSFDEGYTIQYSTTSDFSSGNATATASISETSKSITGLTASTTYYYRVSGKRTGIATLEYSNVKSVTTSAPKAPKFALDFDGTNDYVDCGNIGFGGSSVTLEGWVYVDNFLGSAGSVNSIFGREWGGGNLLLRFQDGNDADDRIVNFLLTIGDNVEVKSITAIEENRWYHIAGVYDGTNMMIYLNGVLDNSSAKSGSFSSSTFNFYIGTKHSHDGDWLDGKVDEVRVWDDARSITEIQDNMFSILEGNEANLVAYYRFDDGSGTTLTNLTGNGNNGTLTGGPAWINSYAMVLAADATSITDDGFTANWSCPAEANSSYNDGFTIEYSTSSDFSGSSTTTALSSATSKSITGLAASTTYYYRVSGKRTDIATLEYSNVKSVTTAGSSTVVTSNADDGGTGTLRYIIANCDAGAEITFNLSAGNETISLLTEDIDITKSLTINGDNTAGSGTDVTVQVAEIGVSTYRVFHIHAAAVNVTLSNMTIKGGNIIGISGLYDDRGGCILILESGSVELNTLTISGGKARDGGGIACELSAALTMTDCMISGNFSSSSGGGIYLDNNTSPATFTACTIMNNSADNRGGGIESLTQYSTLTECIISGNTSGDNGGGLYLTNGHNLIDCTISNNSCPPGSTFSSSGGGIFYGYSINLTGCTIKNNSAGNSGALAFNVGSTTSVSNITNCTFYGNHAVFFGAMSIPYIGSTYITNTTITGNYGEQGVGGILIYDARSNLYITNSIIAYNYTTGTSYTDVAYSAGAVFGNNSILGGYTLSGSNNTNYSYSSGQGVPLFASYTEISAGAIYKPVLADNGGNTETVALASNSIAIGAGVRTGEYESSGTKYVFHNGTNWVKVEDGSTVVSSGVTEITTDQRGEPRSQSVPVIGSYSPLLSYVVTSNANDGVNTLRYAIANCEDGAEITFNLSAGNETISLLSEDIDITKSLTINGDNSAGSGTDVTVQVETPGSGGSNYRVFLTNIGSGNTIELSNMTIKGGDISGGSTYNEIYYGGSILHKGGGTLDLDNVTVSGSKADFGGAIYISYSTLTTINSTISNTTAKYGGGVYVGNSTLTTNNFTINNTTASRTGGGIYIESSTLTMNNSTISSGYCGGWATCRGGAVYSFNSNASLTSCEFLNNTADHDGGAFYSQGGDTFTITDCSITNNSSGTNGGGVYCSSESTLLIKSSNISGNSAASNGGGIYCFLSSSDIFITLNNSTINGNSASSDGGGIYVDCENLMGSGEIAINLTVTNSTVCGNSSSGNGAGIYAMDDNSATTSVYLTNTITTYNYKSDNSSYIDVYNSNATLYGNYNIMGGFALSGSNNTNYSYTSGQGDPLFANYTTISENAIYKPVLADNGGSTETVALASNSMAIGAGVRTGEYESSGTKYVFHNGTNWVKVEDGSTVVSSGVTEITTDQREENRRQFSPSIGAYEPTNYGQEWTGTTSSTWQTASNWSPESVPQSTDDITIPEISSKASTLTIGATETADCNNLTVEANGSLTIQSTSSGTGSLIINGDLSNSGTITSQCYLTGAAQAWHMISSPAVVDISENYWNPGDNDDFYAWKETSPGVWVNYKNSTTSPTFVEVNGSDNFVSGKGYLVAYNTANPTKSFAGTLNTGSKTFPLANTASGKDWTYVSGWNLMGNPYSSSIDWSEVDHTETSLFQDNYAYMYDPNISGFVYVDGASPNAYIPPHQGFFVLAEQAANGQNFTFTKAMQTHGDGANVYKAKEEENKLTLLIASDEYFDKAQISQVDASDWSRDRYDALKMFSYNSEVPQLFSISSDNVWLAINSLPELGEMHPAPLGLRIPEDGVYEISITNIPSQLLGIPLYIEDLKSGQWHRVDDKSMSFTEYAGDVSDRFVLHLGAVGIEETDNGSESNELQVFSHGKNITIINNHNLTGDIVVLNMLGRQVESFELQSSTKQTHVTNLPYGVYVVYIKTSAGSVYSEKVIVN